LESKADWFGTARRSMDNTHLPLDESKQRRAVGFWSRRAAFAPSLPNRRNGTSFHAEWIKVTGDCPRPSNKV
jgi:hypothetical protein